MNVLIRSAVNQEQGNILEVLLNNAIINEYAVGGSKAESLFSDRGIAVSNYIEIIAPVTDNSDVSTSYIRDTFSNGVSDILYKNDSSANKISVVEDASTYNMKLLYVNKFLGDFKSLLKIYISLEEKEEKLT